MQNQDNMEPRKVFLVIADISGYTRFIRLHKMSLLHAELIVGELLESVIKESDHPLILHELEGDAVTFYAESDGGKEQARDILLQVQRFFTAFREKESELVSDCGFCICDACRNVGKLKLKTILHHGEAVITQIRHFNKVAGEDVILAHRLLKNSIQQDEYFLLTDEFHRLSGDVEGMVKDQRREKYEGFGTVDVNVYYPHAESVESSPAKRSIWDKLHTTIRFDTYMIKRLLGKPRITIQKPDEVHGKAV
jgi:hypothetical protein